MTFKKKLFAAVVSVGVVGGIALGTWVNSQPTPFKPQNSSVRNMPDSFQSEIKIEQSDYSFVTNSAPASVTEMKEFRHDFAEPVQAAVKINKAFHAKYPNTELKPFTTHTQVKKDDQGFFLIEGDIRSSCVEMSYSVHRHFSTVPYYSLLCTGTQEVVSLIDVFPLTPKGGWDVVASIRFEPVKDKSGSKIDQPVLATPSFLCELPQWGDATECKVATNIMKRYFNTNDNENLTISEATATLGLLETGFAMTRIVRKGPVSIRITEDSLFNSSIFPDTLRQTQLDACQTPEEGEPLDALCFIKFPKNTGLFDKLTEHH